MTDATASMTGALTGFDMAAGPDPALGVDSTGVDWAAHSPRVRVASRTAAALETGRSRLLATAAMFMLCFGAVALKTVDATVLAGGQEPTHTQAAAALAPSTARADILDRNGVKLATSVPTASLYADPKLVIEPELAARRLAAVLPGLDAGALLADLSSDRRFVWVRRNLTPAQQYEINRLGIPGLFFQREERRIYPQGSLAAHVVGFTGVDNTGLTGVEKRFDNYLREGQGPLQLSLDVRVQHVLRKEIQHTIDEFDAIGGAGMVMDVHTGELLAMVSLPDFDPHQPPTGEAKDEDTDPRFNRNTLGVYEMGSTFKIFNSAMVLESGRARLNDMFDASKPLRYGRHTISDFKGKYRWMSVAEIFQYSSNIGSVKMAETVGPLVQKEFMASLGFTRPVSLEVPERGSPMVPAQWREVNMATISYGHGMSVSPAHLVAATAAMVNGGLLFAPTLLKSAPGQEPEGTRVISERTSAQLRKLMRLVVSEGTAKTADAQGYIVGGKTGTAEKVKGRSYSGNARISSFVGAFPIHDPRYVVYVMVDEPKGNKRSFGYATGGWTAAPAVGRIVAQIGPLLGMAPVDPESPEIVHALAIQHPQAPAMPQLASVPAGPRR